MSPASAAGGRWTAADVPDQHGRTAVLTGAGAGVGLETARELARQGATVILACRDMGKAGRTADQIRARVQGGRACESSILTSRPWPRSARGQEIRSTCPRLDLLINNAGVMAPPYQRTEDGFELTFATNHLGHFALTGLVLDRLLATPGSRIVTVSSVAHAQGVMHFDDLQFERGYQASPAYAQSKLANLLFAYELQARLEAAGAPVISLAAHPGVVRTGLWQHSSGLERVLISPRLRLLNIRMVQDSAAGALPSLRAATDPAARGGEYYGPSGRREFTGSPVRVESSSRSHDAAAQRRLWDVSEQLTGVTYRIPAAAAAPGDESA